jgi:nitrogen regulatory protein P-II 2
VQLELSNMKLVTAIIKPMKLAEVCETLNKLGFSGMTVTEVRGYGRQRGRTDVFRGAEYSVNFVPKLKIEIVCNAEMVDRAVEAITVTAQTGRIGDGKIFVSDLGHIVRIRTRETGSDAI